MQQWKLVAGAAIFMVIGSSWTRALCARAHALEPQKKPHQENRAQLMVDVVFGLQATESDHHQAPVAAPLASAAGTQLATAAPMPITFGATQSLMFAGLYAVDQSLHIGARTAVTLASGVPTNDGFYGAVAVLSNTEIEGEHLIRLSHNTEASLGLGLILPTAQGHEPEDDLFAEDVGIVSAADLTGLHGELSEAAAATRGFEDGALFRAERVGLIPKVHIAHHDARLRLESHVKLENLLSVRSAPHHRYLGELVVGGFYGYDVFDAITLGVRLWSNVLLEKTEETNLICEPQLQIHGAHIQGLIGALMPIVQRREAPTGLTGVRLAAAALF
jgi:hypothetical protein